MVIGLLEWKPYSVPMVWELVNTGYDKPEDEATLSQNQKTILEKVRAKDQYALSSFRWFSDREGLEHDYIYGGMEDPLRHTPRRIES